MEFYQGKEGPIYKEEYRDPASGVTKTIEKDPAKGVETHSVRQTVGDRQFSLDVIERPQKDSQSLSSIEQEVLEHLTTVGEIVSEEDMRLNLGLYGHLIVAKYNQGRLISVHNTSTPQIETGKEYVDLLQNDLGDNFRDLYSISKGQEIKPIIKEVLPEEDEFEQQLQQAVDYSSQWEDYAQDIYAGVVSELADENLSSDELADFLDVVRLLALTRLEPEFIEIGDKDVHKQMALKGIQKAVAFLLSRYYAKDYPTINFILNPKTEEGVEVTVSSLQGEIIETASVNLGQDFRYGKERYNMTRNPFGGYVLRSSHVIRQEDKKEAAIPGIFENVRNIRDAALSQDPKQWTEALTEARIDLATEF